MSTELTQPELLDIQHTKKEELEAEFHIWLQAHFDSSEDKYINTLVSYMDETTFCKLAEEWATDKKRNKVFY